MSTTTNEYYHFNLRRDTAANWTSANPVLGSGEPGYESDTNKLKFGDGTTAWTSLEYFPVTTGASGSFTSSDSKTVTVVNGLITTIS